MSGTYEGSLVPSTPALVSRPDQGRVCRRTAIVCKTNLATGVGCCQSRPDGSLEEISGMWIRRIRRARAPRRRQETLSRSSSFAKATPPMLRADLPLTWRYPMSIWLDRRREDRLAGAAVLLLAESPRRTHRANGASGAADLTITTTAAAAAAGSRACRRLATRRQLTRRTPTSVSRRPCRRPTTADPPVALDQAELGRTGFSSALTDPSAS